MGLGSAHGRSTSVHDVSGPIRDVTPLPDLLHGRSTPARSASSRPRLRRPAAALQRRLPGRGEHPGLAVAHAGRPARAGLARSWSRTIRSPAIHGRVCYHPCESVCNRAELDSAVSIHSVERFLGDLALEQGWRFDRPAGPQRSAGPRRRRRPVRPVRRLPPRPARARGGDPRRRRAAGRDDALRHPGLSPAARRARPASSTGSRRWACG